MPRRRTVDPGQLNLFNQIHTSTAPELLTNGALALDTQALTAQDVITEALAHAARTLHNLLPEDGNHAGISRTTLRQAMHDGFAQADPHRHHEWSWQDAYEACEAAQTLWLLDPLNKTPESPTELLNRADRIEHLFPTQSIRSQEQLRYQQFSTPLALACLMGWACNLNAADTLLEPSAGTGILAAAACYAARLTTERPYEPTPNTLLLNELAPRRRNLLARILQDTFGHATVSGHDAAQIDNRLQARPTVCIANPPFTHSAGSKRQRQATDMDHLASTARLLPEGGRLVALTMQGRDPALARWRQPMEDLGMRVAFSTAASGKIYRKRGTNTGTRLTVWEKTPARTTWKEGLEAETAHDLLELLLTYLPARRSLPHRIVDLESERKRRHVERTPEKTPIQTPNVLPGVAYAPASVLLDYGPAPQTEAPNTDRHSQPWRPTVVSAAGQHRHPTPLVESAAMSTVAHLQPDYRPYLPAGTVEEGRLSDAQIESVVLCGNAHDTFLKGTFRLDRYWEKTLPCDPDGGIHPDVEATAFADDPGLSLEQAPVRFRRGWFLGDGTGCGKGRQIAAVIWDNFARGRNRALWLSQSDKLIEDARRDWQAIGGLRSNVVPLWKYPLGKAIDAPQGILFATYASLRQPARDHKASRLEQIIDWLSGGGGEVRRRAFEGVIVFDESHALAGAAGRQSARGRQRPSQQGICGLRLQNALPQARVCYVSATGASTLDGLAYARRLGLWQSGLTPFRSREEFVQAMEEGGVGALEVIARDLKAMGLYQARALTYDGVEVDILDHPLTDPQRRIYDAYASAFKTIHANIEKALRHTGAVSRDDKLLNRDAKASAISLFESTKQRFFAHLLAGMKCPSLIRAIENDIEAGNAAVVQISSTGEALMDRRLAEVPTSEWQDLQVDLTPRDNILGYLEQGFPVQLQETWVDEDGNEKARPAFDAEGRAILSLKAIAERDRLIESLAALPPVPTALDQLVHHFGDTGTAEITGRSRRILRLDDGRLALKPRSQSANLSDADAFQAGEKHLLIFSQAGGTGRSYHADKELNDNRRRIHYLLEPGWRADVAIQGLGRTHRTHQTSPPVFRPVITDVKGEKRFVATIASRLDSLGAITRGQRKSQGQVSEEGQSLFRDTDDMESPYAKSALRNFYQALHREEITDWPLSRFENETGLTLQDNEGRLLDNLPEMSRFLNRLLALPIAEQNQLFESLESRIESKIQEAVEAGTYETGVETLRAHSLQVADEEALSHATTLVHVRRREPLHPLPLERALQLPEAQPVRNERSGRPPSRCPPCRSSTTTATCAGASASSNPAPSRRT